MFWNRSLDLVYVLDTFGGPFEGRSGVALYMIPHDPFTSRVRTCAFSSPSFPRSSPVEAFRCIYHRDRTRTNLIRLLDDILGVLGARAHETTAGKFGQFLHYPISTRVGPILSLAQVYFTRKRRWSDAAKEVIAAPNLNAWRLCHFVQEGTQGLVVEPSRVDSR